MRVLLSWLIANLEIASIFILLPFITIAVNVNPDLLADHLSLESTGAKVFSLLAISVMFGGFPSEGFISDLLALVMSVLGALCFLGMNCTESLFMTHLVMCGVAGLAMGIATAIYAAANFYDVVSLRWIFANSAANKFAVSTAYSFSRFCAGFHLGVYLYGSIILI